MVLFLLSTGKCFQRFRVQRVN